MEKIITEANGQRFKIVTDFFIYTASFGAIAANASQQVNINIQADSSFTVQKLTYFALVTAGTEMTADSRVLPNLTIAITDTGSGRDLQNSAVPITSICGIGELPHILSTPKVFNPNSNIQTALSEFGGDGYSSVFINYIGFKTFKIEI